MPWGMRGFGRGRWWMFLATQNLPNFKVRIGNVELPWYLAPGWRCLMMMSYLTGSTPKIEIVEDQQLQSKSSKTKEEELKELIKLKEELEQELKEIQKRIEELKKSIE